MAQIQVDFYFRLFFSEFLLYLLYLSTHKPFDLFLQERENEIQKLRNQVIQNVVSSTLGFLKIAKIEKPVPVKYKKIADPLNQTCAKTPYSKMAAILVFFCLLAI